MPGVFFARPSRRGAPSYLVGTPLFRQLPTLFRDARARFGIPSIRAAPRRRARISPPAQVAPQPKVDAALAAWRAGDGSWNLGAVDRAIAGGTASVAFGFFGLLVLDVLALVFFGGAAKSLIFDAGA